MAIAGSGRNSSRQQAVRAISGVPEGAGKPCSAWTGEAPVPDTWYCRLETGQAYLQKEIWIHVLKGEAGAKQAVEEERSI